MTENNSLKKIVRARMAILGENYTTAKVNLYNGEPQTLRALFGESGLAQLQSSALKDNPGLIVVCGKSGAGKTSTVASLIRHYEEAGATAHARTVILENDLELAPLVNGSGEQLPLTSMVPKGDVTLEQLLRAALRTRPDLIVVGEIRSASVLQPFIRSLSSGYSGITTLHGNGLRQIFGRLSALSSSKESTHGLIDSLAVIVEQSRISVDNDSVVLTAVIPMGDELRKLAKTGATDEQYQLTLESLGIESLAMKLATLQAAGLVKSVEGKLIYMS